jgi:hypothetical protein
MIFYSKLLLDFSLEGVFDLVEFFNSFNLQTIWLKNDSLSIEGYDSLQIVNANIFHISSSHYSAFQLHLC